MRFVKPITAMGLVLVTGCTITPPKIIEPMAATEGGKILKFVAADPQHDLSEMVSDTLTLNASLRAIPGALSGRPSPQHALLVPIHPNMDFELSMTALEAAIAPQAAAATPAMRSSGIRVSPDSTRMARVGTLVFNSASGRDVLGAGFIDADATTSMEVSLVYFDRACSVRGEATEYGVTYAYALQIPTAGLHWLRLDAANAKRVQVSLADPRTTIWFAGYR